MLELLLSWFYIEVWISESIDSLISHQMNPWWKLLAISLSFFREVVMKSDEHDQIASSSDICIRIFNIFSRERCLTDYCGYFNILKEFLNMLEEKIIELFNIRVDYVEYLIERVLDIPSLLHIILLALCDSKVN